MTMHIPGPLRPPAIPPRTARPAAGAALDTVIVIAKQPRPGFAKTRLTPPLSPADAAALAAAALTDTLLAAAATPAAHHLLAFDGDSSAWLPGGWDLSPQPAGDLDARLVAAFAAAGDGPSVLVGMDTPQLHPGHLVAWDPTRFDACLGPAADGGYWAIGLADPRRAGEAIGGIAMSRDDTGARQLDRLHELGLRVQLLDELTDVDTIDDAHRVARLAPFGSFGRAVRRAA